MAKTEFGYHNGVRLLPTPVVGDRVLWFERADRNNYPVAADVIQVEASGRVTLKLHRRYPKGRNNECIDGCRHVSDESHQETNANTMQCGGWDWLRDQAPVDQYEYHLAELLRKDKMREEEVAQAAKRIKARKELAAATSPV